MPPIAYANMLREALNPPATMKEMLGKLKPVFDDIAAGLEAVEESVDEKKRQKFEVIRNPLPLVYVDSAQAPR